MEQETISKCQVKHSLNRGVCGGYIYMQYTYIEVLTITGEPQGGVSLLVFDVNMCTTSENKLHKLVVALVCSDGKSCIPGAGHWSSIHICTLGKDGCTSLYNLLEVHVCTHGVRKQMALLQYCLQLG